MRQVPQYLLIGNGQMASHMAHYCRYLDIPYRTWSRANNTFSELARLAQQSHCILVLIKDSAIVSFIEQHLSEMAREKLIHFSGSLTTSLAYSAHPLCSFRGTQPYEERLYRRVPFILEEGSLALDELLPGFPNKSFHINAMDKRYYHSLCMIGNNFTALLWQKLFTSMQERFAIDKESLLPLLESTVANIHAYPEMQITGPIARKDHATLQENLASLDGDNYQAIFKAFIEAYA